MNGLGAILGISFIITLLAAWGTHIVTMIQMASETGSAIALLLVGFFIPPIGVIHGISIWLGMPWI